MLSGTKTASSGGEVYGSVATLMGQTSLDLTRNVARHVDVFNKLQENMKDPSAPKENWAAVILRSTYSMKSFDRWGRSPRKYVSLPLDQFWFWVSSSFSMPGSCVDMAYRDTCQNHPKSNNTIDFIMTWYDDSGCYPSFSNMKPVFHICPTINMRFPSFSVHGFGLFSQSFVSSQSKMVTLELDANTIPIWDLGTWRTLGRPSDQTSWAMMRIK